MLVNTNFDLASQELEKTLVELKSMGLTPIIVSPPPATEHDTGQCLVNAELSGTNLDGCNFSVAEISQEWVDVYRFLENMEGNYQIIRLDNFICDTSLCNTHYGSTYIYRDRIHLSIEGSAELGRMNNFYNMVVAER
jgi:hypothetical protein